MAKSKLAEHPLFQHEEWTWCRSIRHQWDLSGPLSVENNGRELHYVLQCDRCKMERVDVMHLRGVNIGEFIARYYRYPKGYLLKGFGEDRPTAAQIRGIHFQQVLNNGERAVVQTGK